jgi:hypothetical protein
MIVIKVRQYRAAPNKLLDASGGGVFATHLVRRRLI